MVLDIRDRFIASKNFTLTNKKTDEEKTRILESSKENTSEEENRESNEEKESSEENENHDSEE